MCLCVRGCFPVCAHLRSCECDCVCVREHMCVYERDRQKRDVAAWLVSGIVLYVREREGERKGGREKARGSTGTRERTSEKENEKARERIKKRVSE